MKSLCCLGILVVEKEKEKERDRDVWKGTVHSAGRCGVYSVRLSSSPALCQRRQVLLHAIATILLKRRNIVCSLHMRCIELLIMLCLILMRSQMPITMTDVLLTGHRCFMRKEPAIFWNKQECFAMSNALNTPGITKAFSSSG